MNIFIYEISIKVAKRGWRKTDFPFQILCPILFPWFTLYPAKSTQNPRLKLVKISAVNVANT